MKDTLKAELLGSWDLVSYQSVSPEGAVAYPLGDTAQGIIVYSADGCVAVTIMRSGRTGLVDRSVFSDGELRYMDLPYLSYTGTYTLDAARPSVTHLVEVCIYPEWIGHKQFRIITWNAGQLKLSSQTPVGSAEPSFSLLWQRKF